MADYPFVLNGTQTTYRFDGPFPAGTTFRLDWDGVTVNNPCASFLYSANGYGDETELVFSHQYPFGTTGPQFLQGTIALPRNHISGSFWTSSYCSAGTVHDLRLTTTFAGESCQFGTELSPTGTAMVFATSALLATLAGPFGWAWTVDFLAGSIGGWFNMAQLCQSPPPPAPPAGWDPRTATLQELGNQTLRILWFNNCRCVPGSPTPVPYPPPVIDPPPGFTAPPAIGCSNTDICALLTQMASLLRAMNVTLNADYELDTLLQRYGLPFATISGARHSGLTGDGSFGVSRLVGIQIDIVDLVEPHRELEGVPKYVWDLGWVSVGTANGMDEERRITRLSQLWFPARMQNATTLGFHFKAGVTGSITELQAEP